MNTNQWLPDFPPVPISPGFQLGEKSVSMGGATFICWLKTIDCEPEYVVTLFLRDDVFYVEICLPDASGASCMLIADESERNQMRRQFEDQSCLPEPLKLVLFDVEYDLTKQDDIFVVRGLDKSVIDRLRDVDSSELTCSLIC